MKGPAAAKGTSQPSSGLVALATNSLVLLLLVLLAHSGQALDGEGDAVDCEVGDFLPVTLCSVSCGNGTQLFARDILTPPQNNGTACPSPLSETRSCNLGPCPVNCEVSPWEAITACTATCGGGTLNRVRTVTIEPMHGGDDCPALEDIAPCNTDPCPQPEMEVQNGDFFFKYAHGKDVIFQQLDGLVPELMPGSTLRVSEIQTIGDYQQTRGQDLATISADISTNAATASTQLSTKVSALISMHETSTASLEMSFAARISASQSTLQSALSTVAAGSEESLSNANMELRSAISAETLRSNSAISEVTMTLSTSIDQSLETSLSQTVSTSVSGANAYTSGQVSSLSDALDSQSSTLVSTIASEVGTLSAAVAQQLSALSTMLASQVLSTAQQASTALAAANSPDETAAKIVNCNKLGLMYDSNTDTCFKLPQLTADTFSTCDSASTGIIRFNNGLLQACYGSAFRAFFSPLGLESAYPGDSCRHIYENDRSAKSGIYWLKMADETFRAYCDMEVDGGGWTMVMMIGSSGANAFYYGSSYWSTTGSVNPTALDPSANTHMISLAYARLEVEDVRIAIGTYSTRHIHSIEVASARDLFNGGSRSVSTSRSSFFSFTTNSGISSGNWNNQAHCNVRGFNVYDGHGGRCRYGNIMNNENECYSSDSAIGIGCFTNGQANGPRAIGAGGFRWDPSTVYALRAWVLVR